MLRGSFLIPTRAVYGLKSESIRVTSFAREKSTVLGSRSLNLHSCE